MSTREAPPGNTPSPPADALLYSLDGNTALSPPAGRGETCASSSPEQHCEEGGGSMRGPDDACPYTRYFPFRFTITVVPTGTRL